MAESRCSPGEWWLHEDGRTVYAGRAPDDAPGVFPWPGEHFVCEVGDTVEGLDGDDPVADANARLIAAAPAMYEALRDIYQAGMRPTTRTMILAALVLAEGGPPP
jgi:hypothetical protein